jgi:hypothetical protein
MKKICLLIIFLFLFISLSGQAKQKMHRITLKDASVVIGKVVSMQDGVYVIESPVLGKVQIEEDNIVEIRLMGKNERLPEVYEDQGARNNNIEIHDGAKKNRRVSPARRKYEQSVQDHQSSGSNDMGRQQQEVNSRVRSMTADGDFVDSLLDLSENQSMMDVMADHEVMDAISRNDYDFLMNNEKMINLMESQDIKGLLGDVE